MTPPRKVLITGGREIGGLASFADALRQGFTERGIETEVISPSTIFRRLRELRDPAILKILSTTAVYAAPLARRAICMAHGFPRADAQGWPRVIAILGSLKLSNASPGTQLVAVSYYAAVHLRTIFGISVDAVIHNPLDPVFLETPDSLSNNRPYITYVGRLVPAKNIDRLLPAIQSLLDENPGMRACIIGDGELRPRLEIQVRDDSRFEFLGAQPRISVRDRLRQTRLFVSGCETEAFGLSYLEAISQGCSVAMPACGGGLEVAPCEIGRSVQLLPLSWDESEVLAAMRRAVARTYTSIPVTGLSASTVTSRYLDVDLRFSSTGKVHSSAGQ